MSDLTLPTNQKTWTDSGQSRIAGGVANATACTTLFHFIVTQLKLVPGCTVIGSSDGVLAAGFNFMDGVDRCTSSSVWAVASATRAAAQAWIVLKFANMGNRYVTLARGAANKANVEISEGAPTQGGVGTEHHFPTAGTGAYTVNTESGGAFNGFYLGGTSTASALNYSAHIATDGSHFRYICFSAASANGFWDMGLHNSRVHSDWAYDGFLSWNWIAGSTASNTQQNSMYAGYGLRTRISTQNLLGFNGSTHGLVVGCESAATGSRLQQFTTYPELQNTNPPPATPSTNGIWPVVGLAVSSQTASWTGFLCSLADLYWGKYQATSGQALPLGGGAGTTHVYFGDLILPWPGYTPVVA